MGNLQKQLIFFSTGKLPYKSGSGSSVLTEAMLSCFIELGFAVIVIPVSLRYTDPEEQELHINYLRQKGITVRYFDAIGSVINSKSRVNTLRQVISPQADDYFHHSISAKQELLIFLQKQDRKNTILYAYSWEATAVIANIDGFFKISSTIDPLEKYQNLRRDLKPEGIYRLIRHKMDLWRGRKKAHYAYAALSQMNVIIQHAYHHSVEFTGRGFKNVHYIPHPLMRRSPISKEDNNEVTILISGSLKGTASRHGFLFFLDELLPRLKLKQQQILSKIVFRVVGHGQMQPAFKERLVAESMVNFVGFAENIEDEYAKADIVLVNIPVTLGFRTRIAEAFSYGLCVAAHAANAEGMPEIRDEINAMSDSDPDKLADKLIRLINEPALRQKLGEQAKITFDNEISMPVAVEKIDNILKTHQAIPDNKRSVEIL